MAMNENVEGNAQARDYKSYLLRLWRNGSTNSTGWRASVEDARTGERFGFASLEELFAFLMQLVGASHVDPKS